MKKTILAAIPMCAGLMFAQTTGTDMNQSTGQSQTTGQSQATTPSATQNPNDMSRNTSGQTWSGILVASGCNSSSMNGAWSSSGQQSSNSSYNMGSPTGTSAMNRSTNAAGGGDLNKTTNTTDRMDHQSASVTGDTNRGDMKPATGSVDQSASIPRGTQPGDMNRNTVGDRSVNTPQTGMADRERGGDTSATASARNTAGSSPYSNENMNNNADRSATGNWESGAQNTGGWDKGCFIGTSTSSFVFLTKDGRQMRLDDASNAMIQQRLSSTNRVSDKNKIFRVRITGNMDGDRVHVTDIQM